MTAEICFHLPAWTMTQIAVVGIDARALDKWAQAFRSSGQTCISSQQYHLWFRKIFVNQQKGEAWTMGFVAESSPCREWWKLVSNLHNYSINVANGVLLYSCCDASMPVPTIRTWKRSKVSTQTREKRGKWQRTMTQAHRIRSFFQKQQRLYDDFRLLCYLVRDCITTW